MRFKDCYARYDESIGRLVVGNSRIEKRLRIAGCLFRVERVYDVYNGVEWTGDTLVWQRFPALKANETPVITVKSNIIKGKAWISDHFKLVVELNGREGCAWYECVIFPEVPFIYTQIFIEKRGEFCAQNGECEPLRRDGVENAEMFKGDAYYCDSDTLECVPLRRGHYNVEAILLNDKTDVCDNLLERKTVPVYQRGKLEAEGSIFLLNDYPNGNSLMFVKHAPVPGSALNRRGKDFIVMGNSCAALTGNGVDFSCMPSERTPYYASAIGVSKTDAIHAEFWRYGAAFARGDARRSLFVMSNTWGDRSQDMAVSEAFILAELENAHKLGIDILQIDDGWESGITANSLRKKGGAWEDFYGDSADFWAVNKERFPNGLEPIIEKAKEYGVELGLWFAPDSSDDFKNIDADIETLWGLYQKYGVRYFKLDSVKIRSKTGEIRFIRFLNELTERSAGDMRFNLDVTADDRFGYLYEMQYGTLFVENRYTDFVNYYPHNTFKNLWNLASVIPARRLQMELLNPRRNAAYYGDMPFAPNNYGIDYLFATVMPANPLAWMELSNLSDEDAATFGRLSAIYSKHKAELFECRVVPIGDCPNGMSFSGYFCESNDGISGHILLFREETIEREHIYGVPLDDARLTPIYISDKAEYAWAAGGIRVSFSARNSFIWLKYTRNSPATCKQA